MVADTLDPAVQGDGFVDVAKPSLATGMRTFVGIAFIGHARYFLSSSLPCP